MITRNPSLTDQVKAHIKDRIVNDDFADDRIPPEATLGEELGVSRTTIRDALAKLENEGAIYRKQGSGTFVNRPGLQIKSRLEEIWSYAKVLEDHGYTPSVSVISDHIVPRTTRRPTALALEVGDDVSRSRSSFSKTTSPCPDPQPDSASLLDADHSRDDLPLYEFLEEYCDRRLSYYVSEIVPVAFGAAHARKLGVKRGTVGLAFVEVGYRPGQRANCARHLPLSR